MTDSTKPVRVGSVELKLDITVEPAVMTHHMWEASVEHFDLCALGKTPAEAVASLGKAMKDRGIVDLLNVDPEKVDAMVLGGGADE